MYSKQGTFLVGIFMAMFCFVSTAGAETFVRNLKQGDRGVDVRALQIILNSDTETRIANEGPGSPGQETEYFGTLTYQATVRLQEKYRQDILIPNGLFAGTGFVKEMRIATAVLLTVDNALSTSLILYPRVH